MDDRYTLNQGSLKKYKVDAGYMGQGCEPREWIKAKDSNTLICVRGDTLLKK